MITAICPAPSAMCSATPGPRAARRRRTKNDLEKPDVGAAVGGDLARQLQALGSHMKFYFTTGSLIAADVAAVAFCMKVYRGFKLPPKPTAEPIEVYQ